MMKRISTLVVFVNLISLATAQVFTPPSGLWNTASNWSPSGVPANSGNVSIPLNKECFIGANITRTGSTTIQGTLSLNPTTTLINSGYIDFQNNTSWNSFSGSFTNQAAGTLRLTGILDFDGDPFNNAGSIIVLSGGWLSIIPTTQGCVNSGSITNAGSIIISDNMTGSGTITNTGTIGGTFTTASTITNSVGGKIGQTPAQLQNYISSAYDCLSVSTFSNSGTIEFTLSNPSGTPVACTDNDRIAVNTSANLTLGGTFTATYNGTAPNIGKVFTVITHGSGKRTGTFTNSNALVATGKYANITYGATAVTLTISGTPLPVEFVSFDAFTEGGQNKLTWATATEIRAQHYEIERSTDGTKFYTIGTVKAKGSAANYHFMDAAPLKGITYYRLKQLDTDGTFTYTKTEAVETGRGKKNIQVYPTTTKDLLTVENNGLPVESVAVFNPMGQLVFTAQQVNQVDMSALPTGLYLVQVQAGIEKRVEKVFKQ